MDGQFSDYIGQCRLVGSPILISNNLFREKSILKFPDLVTYKTGIIMFKAFACELPTQLQTIFARYRRA